MIRKHSNFLILLIIFVVVFSIMSIMTPDKFLGLSNFQSMGYQIPEFGLLSLAMFFPIIAGGINLSTVATAGLSGVVTSLILTNLANSEKGSENVIFWVVISIIVALFVSLFCGLLNGVLVGVVGVSPILATLGTQTLFHGLALRIAGGRAGGISGFPDQFLWIGNSKVLQIPFPFIIFVIVLIVSLVLIRTPYGFSIYIVGSNPIASRVAGINNRIVLIKTYLLSGLLCGLASIIMISRYNSAKADYGTSYLLQSILAVILGGTSIAGGAGTIQGLLVAILILQVISSGLNIFGASISMYIVDIVWGLLIILVMVIQYIVVRRSTRIRAFIK